IGCNQACLDHTFGGKITSCLVNPRACHETLLLAKPLAQKERIAVVGAGPAGLAFSTEAARRGFDVTLIDAANEIGGQFNVAKQVPGKEEFFETLRYFEKQIERTGVKLQLGRKVSAQDLVGGGYKHVVLATGVNPRTPDIEGIGHPKVLGYLEVLRDKKPVGKTVALIGAGGIGFDVAEFLLAEGASPSLDPAKFFAEWGVDATGASRGGLAEAHIGTVPRKVYLLQRKVSKVGDGLGKTTGWIHRTALKNRGVEMIAGVTYRKVDDAGLHITVGEKEMVLPVDNVVVCAGQDPQRELQAELQAAGVTVHLIGGADKAAELDAKRAIKQGTELALSLDPGAPQADAPVGATFDQRVTPQVSESLAKWHEMVAAVNLGELPSILHPKAVFRSPMAHMPYPGAQVVQLILGTVMHVFQDFTYHRQLSSADGLSVVLEFSATVNGKELKGIDLIRFDEDGKIVDFEVMVRPMSGLQALGDEMAKRLAPYLAAMKGGRA
ncbi:MAG TPA: FAD-dependent oxidoreductase, partial [Burkholderiaceae bacterium]|nr:FAD-dependent oxidoreductase [Burkholderiaceae bacterium]